MNATQTSAICDRIRSAPNAALANRWADTLTADSPTPAFMQKIGSSWALMFGGDHIAYQGDFGDVRSRLASVLDNDIEEDDEDEEVLPRVEDDAGNVIDGDAILPAGFTYHDTDGTEYAYRHTGPDEYEVRRWMPDEGMWWVERSEMIGDEVTVEIFLTMQNS